MKHPGHEILQDYFENALDEQYVESVKDHLFNCDTCTNILADFLALESRLRALPAPEVSIDSQKRIRNDAIGLLSQRRARIEGIKTKLDARKDQLEKMREHFHDWKENFYPELKVPALQLCSLSLVLMTFIAFEKIEGRTEEEYEPLTSEVSVFTHSDPSLKGEI